MEGGKKKKDILFWLFSPISKFCSTYTPYNKYETPTIFQAPNHKGHTIINCHHNCPVFACGWLLSDFHSLSVSINGGHQNVCLNLTTTKNVLKFNDFPRQGTMRCVKYRWRLQCPHSLAAKWTEQGNGVLRGSNMPVWFLEAFTQILI